MYIALLDPDQQQALCRILLFVANVDGIEDHREDALNAALLEESSLDEIPQAAADMDEVKSLLSGFKDRHAGRALLLEAFGVALADAVVHPKELEVIRAIAAEVGVDEAWLERARDYVQRALELQHEGRELLS